MNIKIIIGKRNGEIKRQTLNHENRTHRHWGQPKKRDREGRERERERERKGGRERATERDRGIKRGKGEVEDPLSTLIAQKML